MKKTSLLLAIILVLCLVAGCGGGGGTPTQTATISGKVIDVATSKGISGVAVTINSTTTYSDIDGIFRSNPVPCGTYVLNFAKPGYISTGGSINLTQPGNWQLSSYVSLTSNGTSTLLCMISGHVKDASASLSDVKVEIKNTTSTINTTYTDINGDFNTPPIPCDTYTLTFSKTGYNTQTTNSQNFSTSTDYVINDITLITGGSTAPLSIKIEDLSTSGGSLSKTITANKNLTELIVIPYNIQLSAGTYNTTVNINADSIPLSLFNNLFRLQDNKEIMDIPDLPKNRQIERENTIKSLQLQGIRPESKRKSTYSANFLPGPSNLTFKKDFNGSFVNVSATLVYTGSKCLVYKDNTVNNAWVTSSSISAIGAKFDEFYNRETQYFGNVNLDVDGNDMIYILITELDHDSSGWVLGYFDPLNEYSPARYTNSNQKEMLYITSYNPSYLNSKWLSLIQGTTAHEFQHLINFTNRYDRYDSSETWINEGLSMVAEDLAIKGPGYIHNPDLDSRVNTYLANTTANSLCTWGNTVADYAPAYMFMRYFVDRFSEENIKNIVKSSSIGVNSLLDNAPNVQSFQQLFGDWLTAVMISSQNILTLSTDPTFKEKYSYKTLYPWNYNTFNKYSTGPLNIPDTTGAFIHCTNLDNYNQITVTLNGNSVFKVRLIEIPKSGGTLPSIQASFKVKRG